MLINGFEMSRRDFLSCTAAVAMMAASPFAGAVPAAGQPTTLITQRRTLGRASPLEVSAIGLGCLPMVGYYGGKFEKKDMVALIRRTRTDLPVLHQRRTPVQLYVDYHYFKLCIALQHSLCNQR